MVETPNRIDDGAVTAATEDATAVAATPDVDGETDPLDAHMLASSADVQLEEMLRRLHRHDYLAALVLAESIMLIVPGDGLAKICRKEALVALEPMMSGSLTRGVLPGDLPPSPHAEALLAGANAQASVATLLAVDAERPKVLCTLHELLRLGVVSAARPVTVIERANTLPAPPSKP